ncbi:formyltransferase family protein [Flagellimonas aequoris]|uniref:Formyl transferase N-terminal domain-containing protein n=1 Tax=Flagellimonas aequoris TaxID=2306997 RepID=A0A418N9T0_9FLAO|nr:formyltransferase family protein [Allomuricauda aequoris]RIV72556.1 hypothetical protein D2U88_04790 [Allomuricauda aequoris]TXK05056.1 hypothetical protein FQ019_04760 [Allomuricauda aequoris]
MKNIVFLGSKQIGYECLEYLVENAKELDYNILGVLTNNRGENIKALAQKSQIRILSDLDAFLALKEEVHIAISVQYHLILKKEHINKAKDITINLHMAPLPEYRGCNQFSFAIIDGKTEFGTTLHRLDEGIDSGDILFEKRFPIEQGIWVDQLYEKTFKASIELFQESLPKILDNEYKCTPQKALMSERGTTLHFRKEIEDIKRIDLNWNSEKIRSHIRATYFPGFEPPYTQIGDQKIYFTKTI